ncbi:MAG: hypothetical protein HOI89_08090 [Phycisphaerae bacterium]|nr:hypothetical protein [Phycisphaerae bacterium]
MPAHITISGWMIAIGVIVPAMAAAGSSADLTIGGVDHNLSAGTMPSMFSEDGSYITPSDLAALNQSLLDDGVDTVGHVTILLAETYRGPTLITLFDGLDGSTPGLPPFSLLGVQMTWQGVDTSLVNQDAGGSWTVSPSGDDLIGAGAFQWQQGHNMEALAIAELINMQSVKMELFDLGAFNMADEVLQLITFGSGGSWEVEGTAAFSDTHEIVVDATIIIPSPSGLAMLCIAGFGGRRRRRC